MVEPPESKLFCRLDGLTAAVREQQRLTALADLGVMAAETVPIFDEATQTTARFLEFPICFLGLMTQDRQWLKSAVGLSRIGLMNDLAAQRQIPRDESFCTYIVDSHQVLAISDTIAHPVFANSLLVHYYGIRAYLGAPLLTGAGYCLGTLAVMDFIPRTFTTKDIEYLELMARWSLSEFERNRLLTKERSESVYWVSKPLLAGQYGQGWESNSTNSSRGNWQSQPTALFPDQTSTNSIKVKLLTQLSQELRTPLTSVMGMASVLSREIYGPLTTKQKEYLEIIHHSGQHLVSLVDEILTLGVVDESGQKLHVTSVDIEMLCQQAINSLLQVGKQRQQQIRLSVEPGNRIWLLDKDKVRQMLYYLVFNLIQSAEPGGVIRIHVAHKMERLNFSVWVSHPWLGEGLPQVNVESRDLASSPLATAGVNGSETLFNDNNSGSNELSTGLSPSAVSQLPSDVSVTSDIEVMREINQPPEINHNSRESLGLLLSCHLAEIHGGEISVQGSPEMGYRYMISLPQLALQE